MTDVRELALRNILEEIAVEQKYGDPDIQTSAIPTTGSNFTSQLFYATIKSAEKQDINVFAKVAVVAEKLREEVKTFTIFDTERHFYTKLTKTYKEIEDKHNIPEEHRLVIPKYYGGSNDYLKEVVVLQDLSKDGFITYDRLKSIDWEYASTAVEELAKLHALSIAYQKEYPEDYEAAKGVLKRPMMGDDHPITIMLKQTLSKTAQMVREENRAKLEKFFSETFCFEQFKNFYEPIKRPVIIHSDFRQSNLMHKIDEDGKVQVVIVDYQSLHPGPAANDLLYFIFTGSDGAFRAKYFDRLIDHYYEHMAAALRRLDLDPKEAFPRDIFDQELKEMLPFGLLIAGFLLPMITVDTADVSKDGEAFENESFETMAELMGKSNDLSTRRLNEVVDDYVKWGII
ncbi:uncharacterized protein LOC135085008 [Ostrinia nubilalis]|uniref:uncharacterized protein LOC135085008 n=1 Tax=Ostrinia nubilalis TaxID=29057 RepID=UPI0030822617